MVPCDHQGHEEAEKRQEGHGPGDQGGPEQALAGEVHDLEHRPGTGQIRRCPLEECPLLRPLEEGLPRANRGALRRRWQVGVRGRERYHLASSLLAYLLEGGNAESLVRNGEDRDGVPHVLQTHGPDGDRRDGGLILDFVVDLPRDHHTAGCGKALDPRSQVHSVAVHAVLIMDDVTGVHPDPERNYRLLAQRQLDLDGALHGLDSAGEDAQSAVTVVLEDLAVVSLHGGGENLTMPIPLIVGSVFVLLHQSRVAHHVGEHDGGELTCSLLSHRFEQRSRRLRMSSFDSEEKMCRGCFQ